MHDKDTAAPIKHDDYSRIAHEVVNILNKHQCTHWDADEVFRYADAQIRSQVIQTYEDCSA